MVSVRTPNAPLQRVFDYLSRAHEPRPAPVAVAHNADDLVRAIQENRGPEVARLIASGVDVNQPTADGRLPLVEAMEKGHYAIAEDLAKAGADPRNADRLGRSAMELAWTDANGGREADVFSSQSGKAGRLLAQWKARYATDRKSDYVSAHRQDFVLTETAAMRLDIKAPWLGIAAGPGRNTQESGLVLAEVNNPKSLIEWQQERRAKLVAASEPEMTGRLPLSRNQLA